METAISAGDLAISLFIGALTTRISAHFNGRSFALNPSRSAILFVRKADKSL